MWFREVSAYVGLPCCFSKKHTMMMILYTNDQEKCSAEQTPQLFQALLSLLFL